MESQLTTSPPIPSAYLTARSVFPVAVGPDLTFNGGNVDAFQMRVGDCFDDTAELGMDEAGEVSSLPGVPCADPHDNEVFAVFDVEVDPPQDFDRRGWLKRGFSVFCGRDCCKTSTCCEAISRLWRARLRKAQLQNSHFGVKRTS